MRNVSYPQGFKAWGVACGIKKNGKADLGLLSSEVPAMAFGAFTQNAFKAAPVLHCQKVLGRTNRISHVLVNSGNANACTGERGERDVAEEVASLKTRVGEGEILVSSTGVIGEHLPLEKLKLGIEKLFTPERQAEFVPFVEAIMTTDTFAKVAERSLKLAGREVRIGGAAKGAGMIRPNMATMLCYVTTDMGLPQSYVPDFHLAVQRSFNSISVDGDMSTNDTVLLLANGASGVAYAELPPAEQAAFNEALQELFQDLAKQIVKDGEGATKFITVAVEGANSPEEARSICQAVANSPLVKTAFFGGDPNWGRVVAAAGSVQGIEGNMPVLIDPSLLDLDFCSIPVLRRGVMLAYDEPALAERMREREVSVRLNLNVGEEAWTYWTCDLSYDYIKVNASYRT